MKKTNRWTERNPFSYIDTHRRTQKKLVCQIRWLLNNRDRMMNKVFFFFLFLLFFKLQFNRNMCPLHFGCVASVVTYRVIAAAAQYNTTLHWQTQLLYTPQTVAIFKMTSQEWIENEKATRRTPGEVMIIIKKTPKKHQW